MTEEDHKEGKAIHRLTPLLYKAGLPAEMHREFIEGISSFTTMMTVLLAANQEDAPNYLTFALVTPKGDHYELTVKKSEGKSPSAVIDDLEEELDKAKKEIERLREQSTRLSQDGSRMATHAGTAEGSLTLLSQENKRLRLAWTELKALTIAVGKDSIPDIAVDIESIFAHHKIGESQEWVPPRGFHDDPW